MLKCCYLHSPTLSLAPVTMLQLFLLPTLPTSLPHPKLCALPFCYSYSSPSSPSLCSTFLLPTLYTFIPNSMAYRFATHTPHLFLSAQCLCSAVLPHTLPISSSQPSVYALPFCYPHSSPLSLIFRPVVYAVCVFRHD